MVVSTKLEGRVRMQLPNALYEVELDSGKTVRCNVSGPLKLRMVRLLAGDVVMVQVSSFDVSRGRIVGRIGE